VHAEQRIGVLESSLGASAVVVAIGVRADTRIKDKDSDANGAIAS
jgi:hypothetical protein